MDIVKSRNGYYTITFTNKNNLDDEEIMREFSTVGNVCKIVRNFQRVFIRFQEKEEAERALLKFGKVYDVNMAKNNKAGENHHHEGGNNIKQTSSQSSNQNSGVSSPSEGSTLSLEKFDPNSKVYHLILGNLPRNYTITDVKSLVEEAKPVYINPIDETRVFNIKFCHIVLQSPENLTYLIDKLNGFVICGEKLTAVEAKHLLEWKEKAL